MRIIICSKGWCSVVVEETSAYFAIFKFSLAFGKNLNFFSTKSVVTYLWDKISHHGCSLHLTKGVSSGVELARPTVFFRAERHGECRVSICARVFESERFTVSRVLKSFAADEREVETFFCNDFSLSPLSLSPFVR